MLKKALTFAFIVTLSLTYQATAHADEKSQELKTLFEELIDYQKAVTSLGGETQLMAEGEVTVERSGEYYAVTLPHLKIVHPDETVLEIGIISVNAAPHEKLGQWKMTLALPTPMAMLDKDGKQVMRINIGAQQAAGIWHSDMQYFYKLDASYNDILIEGADPAYTLKIPSMHTRYDFEIDENNRWSGPGIVSLKDIEMRFGQDAPANTIGEVKAQFGLDQYDPKEMRDYREKLMAVAENTDEDKISADHAMGMYNMVFDVLMKSGNGFTSSYSVSDIKLNRKSITGSGEDTLSIDKASLGFDMTGFLSGTVDMGTRFGLHNFNATPPVEYESVAPDSVNFDLLIKNIPFKQVSDLGQNTIQTAISQPGMGQLAGLSFIMKLPALLAQSGTYIEIKDNYIAGDGFKITLDGLARADITAINSATVDATLIFEGLETLLERSKKIAANSENENTDKFKKLVDQLELLKRIGKTQEQAEGEPIYTYKLIMNPQGKILLNDQDVFDILKGKKAPKAVEKTEPKDE